MWVVRLAHPTVNRFRVIAEHTREVAERKAADQIKAWDAEFSATTASIVSAAKAGQQWDAKAAERTLNPKHRLRQLAEQLTVQVQEEIRVVESLLRDASLRIDTMPWGMKDCSPFPDRPQLHGEAERLPAEPSRESYLSHPSFAGYVIPRVRRQKEAEATERFKAAHAEWQRAKSEIEARNRARIQKYERDVTAWGQKREEWFREQARLEAAASEKRQAYSRRATDAVAEYCHALLSAFVYPCLAAAVPSIVTREPFRDSVFVTEHAETFPREFELDYDGEARTVVVDHELPRKEAMPSVKGYKQEAAHDEVIPVPAVRSRMDETYESVLYQVALRTIYELFRWDESSAVDSVVFNGWVTSVDRATGKTVHPCVLTIQATKREFIEINLPEVDPKACFRKLKGISGARLAAMSPVRPILQMNREDKRFVNARPVMDAIDNSTNLAAMDWEDFEQLIRDIFEREFSGDGGEVKITRASRDHGVDAVAFDPDPIRGGKIVIQAKRYTDTVSVSAVRDLYGTILNEGANKGILVTTAAYGADAYGFAKGKPITLLYGSELLYLLKKHGHKARIDLAEARSLAADKGKTNANTQD